MTGPQPIVKRLKIMWELYSELAFIAGVELQVINDILVCISIARDTVLAILNYIERIVAVYKVQTCQL